MGHAKLENNGVAIKLRAYVSLSYVITMSQISVLGNVGIRFAGRDLANICIISKWLSRRFGRV